MKYSYLDKFVISFLIPGISAHLLKGDVIHLLEEKNNLRGRNAGKMMVR